MNNQIFDWANYEEDPKGIAALKTISSQKDATYNEVSNGVFTGNVEESFFTNIDKSLVPEVASVIGEEPMELIYGKGYVEPTPDTRGHDFVEIGGVKWATMNVGATSITDGGLYFQWGDTQGYTAEQVGYEEGQKPFETNDYKFYDEGTGGYAKYNEEDGLTMLELGDDAVNHAWGGEWRTPRAGDYELLFANTNHEWVNDYNESGVNGLLFTDKTDSSKTLFFPAVGCALNGSVNDSGSGGYCWSRSLYDMYVAFFLYFYVGGANWLDTNDRAYGCCVRGVFGQ